MRPSQSIEGRHFICQLVPRKDHCVHPRADNRRKKTFPYYPLTGKPKQHNATSKMRRMDDGLYCGTLTTKIIPVPLNGWIVMESFDDAIAYVVFPSIGMSNNRSICCTWRHDCVQRWIVNALWAGCLTNRDMINLDHSVTRRVLLHHPLCDRWYGYNARTIYPALQATIPCRAVTQHVVWFCPEQ